MASFNATVDRYKVLLANVSAGSLVLANENFDAGGATIAGKYKGADEAYAKLLDKLADHKFAGMQPDLRQNILTYYKDPKLTLPARSTRKERADFTKLLDQIELLKATPEAIPAPQVP